MAHFLIQAAYTTEAVEALIHNPHDRTAVISAPVEKLGGHVHNMFLSFGDFDAVAIIEMPDNIAAAAIALAFASGGSVKSIKTTPLLTTAEGMEAARKAAESGYRSILQSAKAAS
jgi:uncharacterized protein with GYD domain